MDLTERFEFRYIRPEEADQACDIEFECFPPNEYCSREMITGRVVRVPQSFYVAADRESGKLAGFLTSMATDAEAFQDEFFSNADLFDPNGRPCDWTALRNILSLKVHIARTKLTLYKISHRRALDEFSHNKALPAET